MSERIRRIYKRAGQKAPDGKGIHTERFHRCVATYLKKGLSYKEAAKRCMGGIGRDLAVKKAHWKSPVARAVEGRR